MRQGINEAQEVGDYINANLGSNDTGMTDFEAEPGESLVDSTIGADFKRCQRAINSTSAPYRKMRDIVNDPLNSLTVIKRKDPKEPEREVSVVTFYGLELCDW